MALHRNDGAPPIDVRAAVVAELRALAVQFAEFPTCPYGARADLIEKAGEVDIVQWAIPHEAWLTSNPNDHVVIGVDGRLTMPAPLPVLPSLPPSNRPVR